MGVVSLKLFISHVRSGSAWAEWIASTLQQAGHQVFYDNWDLKPGDNIIQYMDSALNATEKTVLVVSEGYFESVYTTTEWQSALVHGADRGLLARATTAAAQRLCASIDGWQGLMRRGICG
jgi:hypothetical protein